MNSNFRTTKWSLVESATTGQRDAVGELIETYWQPIYFHLRRSGYADADAQDLTQAFLAKLWANDGFRTADQKKGRFRTFLLTSLRRFVINEWKKSTTQKRGGTTPTISLDFDAAVTPHDCRSKDLTLDEAFDRQWSLTVLHAAFANLKSEQTNEGNEELFLHLTPLLVCDDQAPSYRELATRVGDSSDALRMRVVRLRSRLRELIRAEIGKTVANPSDIDDEIRHLLGSINRSPRNT